MMSWISVLAFAAALQAPDAPSAQPSPLPAVRAPDADWARRPSRDDLARFYPQRAAQEKVSGDVTLACNVDRSGAVSRCSVSAESPSGYGFGEAALKLAASYAMHPDSAARWAASDHRVLVPVMFRAPGATAARPTDPEWVPRPRALRRLPRGEKT